MHESKAPQTWQHSYMMSLLFFFFSFPLFPFLLLIINIYFFFFFGISVLLYRDQRERLERQGREREGMTCSERVRFEFEPMLLWQGHMT